MALVGAEGLKTVPDAMDFFKVSRGTIYVMCAEGRLEFLKVGRCYRFKHEWFEEAVERAHRE